MNRTLPGASDMAISENYLIAAIFECRPTKGTKPIMCCISWSPYKSWTGYLGFFLRLDESISVWGEKEKDELNMFV